MLLNSSFNFQASASVGFSGGFNPMMGMGQLTSMMRQLMCALQSTGQFGAPRGYGMAPPYANFGGQCGQPSFGGCGNPGLSNFCGGGFGGQNNVNINLPANLANQNVNINIGGMPGQQCGPQGFPQQCGCNGRGQGQVSQNGKGKPINYTTRGGYHVTVDKDKVIVKDPNGNEVKQSGDPHEALNGKHVKDWKDKQRTLVLGDGTKITMSAQGAKGVTQHTSIYDGNQNLQINNSKNEIEHLSRNFFDTIQREQAQYDGETAAFTGNWQGGANYYNMYNQAENGQTSNNFQWIGKIQNGQVQDLFPGL